MKGREQDATNQDIKPPSAVHPLLAEIIRRVVEVYNPERIYLFGSAARGDATPDSDFDLMVIVPDDAPKQIRNKRAIFKALMDIDAPIDILVWPRQQFDERLHLTASFPSTIVREGKLVYAA